jgi:hypothetical protein
MGPAGSARRGAQQTSSRRSNVRQRSVSQPRHFPRRIFNKIIAYRGFAHIVHEPIEEFRDLLIGKR